MMRQLMAILLILSFSSGGEYEKRISDARESLFNEKFEEADRIALEARQFDPEDPESYEVRTSILLFRLRRELDGRTLKSCPTCGGKLSGQFLSEIKEGLRKARSVLKTDQGADKKFILAKIELNQVWFNLEIRGEIAGRSEFRSARALLEDILSRSPNEPRARVALSWIEFVIGRQPWYKKPMILALGLGGGDKDQAIRSLKTAVLSCRATDDNLSCAEAKFGLMEMLKTDGRIGEAKALEEELAKRFPENGSLKEQRSGKTLK